MASCKDCLHVEVCEEYGEVFSLIKGGKCSLFKDRSRFVELSIEPGALLYVPFRNQISKYMVIAVSISKFGVWIDRLLISGIDCPLVLTCVEAIGKTAFLSSKEAERILKERKGDYKEED